MTYAFGARFARSMTLSIVFTWVFLSLAVPLIAVDTPNTSEKNDTVAAAFAVADKDGDQRLSLDEFLVNRAPADVAKRDFKIFDFHRDGVLDLDEFTAVPNVVEGVIHGPLPDPLEEMLDQIIAGLDKALNDWDQHADREFNPVQFFQVLNRRFASRNIRFDQQSADANSNGQISRDEARRFLESQIGLRRGDGKRLRQPNGRVFNTALFFHLDENKNDQIERTEYLARAFYTKEPDREFYMGNANGDDHLSFEEWWTVPLRGFFDPVLEFRTMDANLDGFVSPEELKAGTASWKLNSALYDFPAFDLDGDGKFSMVEYRLTPQANAMLPWDWVLTDTNGDEALSFNEFLFDVNRFPAFDRTQYPLLRLTYFQRYDLNKNGKLEPNEFYFKRRVPDEFFVLNEDGTGWKSLFLFKGNSACGSVAVSSDGKSMAFDSWPSGHQQGSAIYVMEIGGGKPQELCSGMMPSWSKDGQFLTCSRNDPQYGVWMVEVDGNAREHLVQGWGAQWSPDGRRIGFTSGNELKVYNIDSDDYETILTAQSSPYQQIFWNMTWSPDSKQICFKGSKPDGTEDVATVNVVGVKHEIKVHHTGKVPINSDFAWHPKQNRIAYAMMCIERGFMQVYEFDPTKNDPPTLMKGQDEARNNTDLCWMPDGKQLVVVSGDF